MQQASEELGNITSIRMSLATTNADFIDACQEHPGCPPLAFDVPMIRMPSSKNLYDLRMEITTDLACEREGSCQINGSRLCNYMDSWAGSEGAISASCVSKQAPPQDQHAHALISALKGFGVHHSPKPPLSSRHAPLSDEMRGFLPRPARLWWRQMLVASPELIRRARDCGNSTVQGTPRALATLRQWQQRVRDTWNLVGAQDNETCGNAIIKEGNNEVDAWFRSSEPLSSVLNSLPSWSTGSGIFRRRDQDLNSEDDAKCPIGGEDELVLMQATATIERVKAGGSPMISATYELVAHQPINRPYLASNQPTEDERDEHELKKKKGTKEEIEATQLTDQVSDHVAWSADGQPSPVRLREFMCVREASNVTTTTSKPAPTTAISCDQNRPPSSTPVSMTILKRTLSGRGLHRKLLTTLHVHGHHVLHPLCNEAYLLETLPSGVYVEPNRSLQSISQGRKLLVTAVDIEAATWEARQTVVLVDITDAFTHNGSTSDHVTRLSLDVHGRYEAASRECSRRYGEIPPPQLLLRCGQVKCTLDYEFYQQGCHSGCSAVVRLDVPVGQARDCALVAFALLAGVVLSGVVICAAACSSRGS